MKGEGRGRELPSLGPRGEGWVAIQFVFGGLIALTGWVGRVWPAAVSGPSTVAGVVLAVVGVVEFGAGLMALGSSLTPLPKPKETATLRQSFVYRFVRHPVYGGAILVALGWSLARSPIALAPTAALEVLFELKSRREEAWLVERYPDYRAYRARVRRRFVPLVW